MPITCMAWCSFKLVLFMLRTRRRPSGSHNTFSERLSTDLAFLSRLAKPFHKTLGVRDAHTTEIAALEVLVGLGEVVLATWFLGRQPTLGFKLAAKNLLLGESLLIPNLLKVGLDYKANCYSNTGDFRNFLPVFVQT